MKGSPSLDQLVKINPQYTTKPVPSITAPMVTLTSKLETGVPKQALDLIQKLLNLVP